MAYELRESTRKDKKYMLIDLKLNKKIHFGASGYDDYTTTNNNEQKKKYLARHAKNEDWALTGLFTAGFLSRWVLWNKTTIDLSLIHIKKKFKINIKNLI
jgi:hypothetical protein